MENIIEVKEMQEVARKEEEAYMAKVDLESFPDDGVGNDGHRQD